MTDPAVSHLVNVLIQDQRERYSGGLERFLSALAIEGGRKAHEEWASLPATRVVLGALKSMMETVPLNNPSDIGGMARALGMQSGLSLAIRLIEDPTRVFPAIYDGPQALMNRTVKSEEISETYVAPPEEEGTDKNNDERQ